ncbi:MAG: DNA methyltransferase [Anaerolineales bacterium]
MYSPVKAEAHTPPYKIHKYFARRPWNVFNQLVNNFTSKDDIILDPFCGGGVTVYEGLSSGRKVIGCDLNPLAIFVVRNMVKRLDDQTSMLDAYKLCRDYILKLYNGCDTFIDEDETLFGATPIKIEWSEVAFVVKCFYCGNDILLSNENKIKNGFYRCANAKCPSKKKSNPAVEPRLCERNGIKYLFNVGHDSYGKKVVKLFDKTDHNNLAKHLAFLRKEIKKNKISVPKDKIPLNWDRQFEDQLAKKGIIYFQDLFTERNLLINLLLLNFIDSFKKKLNRAEFELLRITFSNVVKDTNIMSFTNDTWQSGKPTTWSKHAYWVPSQFCEVNILDTFVKSEHRIISSLNHNSKMNLNVIEVKGHEELTTAGNLLLWNRSVVDLELPENSVDAVITDPPYGSNVQYLELSHFWYPWNKDLYKVQPDFKAEAVSNRKKNFDGAKTMRDYENNLHRVFAKAFHVLKPEKHMVLTFNNKNVSAWLAVLFSIFKAGFAFEKDGIYFQDGVENYRQTAHTKYEGSPYGDFIYIFRKGGSQQPLKKYEDEQVFWNDLHTIFSNYLSRVKSDKNGTIRTMFLEAMPCIESFAKTYLLDKNHDLYSSMKKDYFDHLYA